MEPNPFAWACGVCPSSIPGSDEACGNVALECRYGATSCLCNPQSGKWACGVPSCPANQQFGHSKACSGPAYYTCDYREEQQTCICGLQAVASAVWCSCPTDRPPDGGACFGTPTCKYAEDTCTCDGHWHCRKDICPAAQPTSGASCSTKVDNCSYASSFCSCDGSKWTCV